MIAENAVAAVDGWVSRLSETLADRDWDSMSGLFIQEQCYWRDLVAVTWNIHTAQGIDEITEMARIAGEDRGLTEVAFTTTMPVTEEAGITEGWFKFETMVGRGRGHVRLLGDKALTLTTVLDELKSFEEPTGARRPLGTRHEPVPGRVSWADRRKSERDAIGRETQPYVLIVGGGHAGIGLAARLDRLNVPTLVVDRNARPGDVWRNRYPSLHLHDSIYYEHLPYIPFPDHWPICQSKDQLADWLEMYVRVMDINYWTSTECVSADFEADENRWRVTLRQQDRDITLSPTHVVFAAGLTGEAQVPEIPGADSFSGIQMHSSEYRGGAAFAGKKVVVLGSNNSAHDVCQDSWEQGAASITMIQRSPSHVVRAERLREMLSPLYSERAVNQGIDVDTADLILGTIPYALQAVPHIEEWKRIRELDAEFYESLDAVGFQNHFGGDGSGITPLSIRRGGGYYVNEGASELIIDGQVKVLPGEVLRLTPTSVVLQNGAEVQADVIVYATGHKTITTVIERVVSRDVARKVGRVWGYGSGFDGDPGPWEGEVRAVWKPTQQPNLWIHGGGLAQARYYSKYLALQLKARMERISTPVYKLAEVHHDE
jgi:putative flavoprotein involved in K+ transport